MTNRKHNARPAEGDAAPGGEATFEQLLAELESIVDQLEKGDLPLEQTLVLHARGQQLAAQCAAQLDEAELKIRALDYTA